MAERWNCRTTQLSQARRGGVTSRPVRGGVGDAIAFEHPNPVRISIQSLLLQIVWGLPSL